MTKKFTICKVFRGYFGKYFIYPYDVFYEDLVEVLLQTKIDCKCSGLSGNEAKSLDVLDSLGRKTPAFFTKI